MIDFMKIKYAADEQFWNDKEEFGMFKAKNMLIERLMVAEWERYKKRIDSALERIAELENKLGGS